MGDRQVVVTGQVYRLRLTVSALAQMASVLEADSPKALAARLRKAGLAEWNVVFRCVATPASKTAFGREKMVEILPSLSALMSEGLRA
jgi:hypothetical protein